MKRQQLEKYFATEVTEVTENNSRRTMKKDKRLFATEGTEITENDRKAMKDRGFLAQRTRRA